MTAVTTGMPVTRTRSFPTLRGSYGWLAIPALSVFAVFFVVPIVSLLAMSLDRSASGVVTLQGNFTLANFQRFFDHPVYWQASIRSIGLAAFVAVVAILLGYPLAFVIARAKRPVWATTLMVMVLSSMQLDMVIRIYGLMVLLGDKGLINGALVAAGLAPISLLFNLFGVIVGLVQFTLPFMVLSLIGTIRGLDSSLEEAARSLGASPWQTFGKVTLPLTTPGILSGGILVFALAVSSYVVPAIMGGWKVAVLPIFIYQQIAEIGRWQFGAAISLVLFALSIVAVSAAFALMSRGPGRATR